MVEPNPLAPAAALEAEPVEHRLALLAPPVVGCLDLVPQLARPELSHGERGRVIKVGVDLCPRLGCCVVQLQVVMEFAMLVPIHNQAAGDKARTDGKTAIVRVEHPVKVTAPAVGGADLSALDFEWCYLPNTAAGQDIRVLDAAETPAAAALLRVWDLAIVEFHHVAQLRYSPSGEYQGAVATSADAAAGYVALGQVAWELATPFTTWWTGHPQYHRDNAAA
jgi:hypothetical protein